MGIKLGLPGIGLHRIPVSSGVAAISNSKSLAFDGSDQHLTTTADSTLATKTYSFWAQSSGVSGNGNTVFSHGDNTLGAFHLNWYSSNSLVILDSDYYQYFNSTSKSTDGDWHHWLVFIDHTDVTACRVFCDGEELGKGSSNTAGSADSYSTGITIGKAASSEHFSGHLDEFAIFDGDKTGIVADLYNNGVPTDLSGTAGLEHWWRMGDATEPAADGTDNFIFDQQDKTLGSEGIVNGTFDSNVTSWSSSSGGTVTWSSGTAITGAVGTDDRGGMSQTFTTVNGAVYQLSFDVISRTSTKWEVYRQGTGAGTIIEGTALGSHSIFFTAASTSTELAFYAKQAGTSDGTVAWDNISVKQVNGATATMNNMATSDIVQYTPNSYILSDLGITPDLAISMTRKLVSDYDSDLYATSGSDITAIFDQSDGSLGSELVTNGDFSSDVSGWTKDGDASSTIGYDSGRLKVTAATNYDGASQSVSGLVVGQTYKFSADYELGTATQLQIRAGSEPSTDLSSPSSGTAVNYFVADSTSMTIYVRTGGSTGTIFFDNISVKKVNGKHLTNGTTATATLSGSGNSARAVFSSSANTVLSSGTAGGSYAAGNHDVFIVFDPVGTDQQVIFGEGTASANLIAMDNGAFSAAIAGITLGEIRVNDAILPATVNRNALWDKMTVSGTMGGLNVLSFEDVDLSSIDGNVSLGADHNTWRLEGYFAEFIITPPLTDAEHSAIVENIRAHYDAP